MYTLRYGRAAGLAVLIAAVLAGCSGSGTPGAKPSAPELEPEPPAHSLLGTWTAPSSCTLPDGTPGTGTLTTTFGATRWYVYRYCAGTSGAFRYIGDGGRWSMDGDVVTRTRLREDVVETAQKQLVWDSDGESFTTHPFHWRGADRPALRKTYTLVARDTLPVTAIEGDWFIRWYNEPHTRFTFGSDGSFELWRSQSFRDSDDVLQSYEFTVTGTWRPGNAADGTLYLSNIKTSGVDSRFPGEVIRASSSKVAEIGIAPGWNKDTIVIWRAIEWIDTSNDNYSASVPTSQDGEPFTHIGAYVR